ncbi:terminase large subunit [Paludisphaera sp.]|uniref:terminase large subunit n=1 Tax=Paludisphaera sp. TaxID=2017432 RepID=UPI00301C322B
MDQTQRRTAPDPKWIRNASDRLAVGKGCWFDETPGLKAIAFIEAHCRQSKGRWGGKPLRLLDWQKDFLMRLFGWRNPDGTRRFRRFYLEVAKKNGKSTMLSALILVFCLLDGESAPEIHVNAVDRSQAGIIFDEAARMIEASPDVLRPMFRLWKPKKRAACELNHGVIQANSADVASKDGANPSHVVFDELHRQKKRDMWDVFAYGSAARTQPILGSITTAGESADGVWHEQREYSEKVNEGVYDDISHLGVVYRALETDDLDDPATWRKANPSLGVTIREEDFRRELEEARRNPALFAVFKRLRLNIITAADTAFVPLERWDACGAPPTPLGPSDAIFAGLDLSTVDDLSALAWIKGDVHDGFDVHAMFFLPEEGIEELEVKHQAPYREWAKMGLITLTPGNVVDYRWIRKRVQELHAGHSLRKLFVDRAQALDLCLALRDEDGIDVEFFSQGIMSVTVPTRELLRLILSERLSHGGNPILRWNASNAVAVRDSNGNIKIDKNRPRKKVDGLSALVNAIAAATSGGGESSATVYDSEELLIL